MSFVQYFTGEREIYKVLDLTEESKISPFKLVVSSPRRHKVLVVIWGDGLGYFFRCVLDEGVKLKNILSSFPPPFLFLEPYSFYTV